MQRYKLVNDAFGRPAPGVFDAERNCAIPADPNNRDYADYQDWLAEGNTPDPAEEVLQ